MHHASALVDLVNEKGEPVSTKTRQAVQKGTDLYHTVFVILKTPDHHIILSKIPERQDLPNLYAKTLGSTAATIRRHQETAREAATRALGQELYIENIPLTKLGEHFAVLPNGHRNYMSVYSGVHPLPTRYSHADSGKLIPFTAQDLGDQLQKEPEKFAPTFRAIWQAYGAELI